MKIQSKSLRYSLFALLYFTQGTILGYFASINARYMLANGLDMGKVGIFSTIALIPFIIKIFFGILSDRYSFFRLGHRKPYIIIGLIVQAVCLVIVANVNPGTRYWTFVAIAFLLQLGMAFYDTCTDGLALDITPENEKGTLQGFMVGGRSVGVIVAAATSGFIALNLGWPMLFYFLAILTLIPIPLVFFIKEASKPEGQRFNWKAFNAFKKLPVIAVSIVGLIIFLVIVGANQLMSPSFGKALGINLDLTGLMAAVWGIGCVVGALLGGMIMDKLGNRLSLWLSIATVVPAMGLLAIANKAWMAWTAAAFFGLAYGWSQAVYFALAMKYTESSIAASMFSILMAFTNIGQGIGLGLGGFLSKKFDFPPTFLIFGGIMLMIIPFFPMIFRKKEVLRSG
jgi:MFS transporter, PAT family, beta-lactamase induction signal transducer AmpG